MPRLASAVEIYFSDKLLADLAEAEDARRDHRVMCEVEPQVQPKSDEADLQRGAVPNRAFDFHQDRLRADYRMA